MVYSILLNSLLLIILCTVSLWWYLNYALDIYTVKSLLVARATIRKEMYRKKEILMWIWNFKHPTMVTETNSLGVATIRSVAANRNFMAVWCTKSMFYLKMLKPLSRICRPIIYLCACNISRLQSVAHKCCVELPCTIQLYRTLLRETQIPTAEVQTNPAVRIVFHTCDILYHSLVFVCFSLNTHPECKYLWIKIIYCIQSISITQ